MIGLLPGLLGLGVVVARTLALLHRPTVFNVVAFALVAGIMVVATLWVRRRCKPRRKGKPGRERAESLPAPPSGRSSSRSWSAE